MNEFKEKFAAERIAAPAGGKVISRFGAALVTCRSALKVVTAKRLSGRDGPPRK